MSEAGRSRSRNALQAVLYVGGSVATAAGLDTVVRGAGSLASQKLANSVVESELRFYAAFYSAYGLAVLRVASRVDRDPAGVRAIAGALFAAGLARANGWRVAGRPHPIQRALLVVELVLPPLLVAMQARSSRERGATESVTVSPPGTAI
jgi:Domain of unknown function (DUF4345)